MHFSVPVNSIHGLGASDMSLGDSLRLGTSQLMLHSGLKQRYDVLIFMVQKWNYLLVILFYEFLQYISTVV